MHKKRVTVVAGAAKGSAMNSLNCPPLASEMGVIGFTRVVGRGGTLSTD